MRSRAVSLPLAWTFSTAASPTGCSVSSVRLRRSASLPAVVWMSISCSARVLRVIGNARHGCRCYRQPLECFASWPRRCRRSERLVGWLGAQRPARPLDLDELRRVPVGPGAPWRQHRRGRGNRLHQCRSVGASCCRRRTSTASCWSPNTRLPAAGGTVGSGPRRRVRRSRCRSVWRAADVPAHAWGWLPLATGVAVVDALSEVTRIVAGLKWPNDVLVGRREAGGHSRRGRRTTAGDRPRVRTQRDDDCRRGTRSGRHLAGRCWASPVTDRNVLLQAVLRDLAARISQLARRERRR